jgi:hypothetical protein
MPPKKAGKKCTQMPPAFDAADHDDHDDLQAIISRDSGLYRFGHSVLVYHCLFP